MTEQEAAYIMLGPTDHDRKMIRLAAVLECVREGILNGSLVHSCTVALDMIAYHTISFTTSVKTDEEGYSRP